MEWTHIPFTGRLTDNFIANTKKCLYDKNNCSSKMVWLLQEFEETKQLALGVRNLLYWSKKLLMVIQRHYDIPNSFVEVCLVKQKVILSDIYFRVFVQFGSYQLSFRWLMITKYRIIITCYKFFDRQECDYIFIRTKIFHIFIFLSTKNQYLVKNVTFILLT